MAEERICVRRIPNPCNSCNIKPCTRKCIFGTLYEKERYSMTRAEAIDKMAKALAFVQAKTFVDKTQWEIVMRGCRYEAEAALNALLEDK